MLRWLAPVMLSLGATLAAWQAPARVDADAAFTTFFQARSDSEFAAAASRIVSTGISFNDAFTRLKGGRAYRADVPRGVVQGSYRDGSGEYFYTLEIPDT